MTLPQSSGLWALSDKERDTLRLIVRGHDAKSIARLSGRSVHTINERLREARRKMAVSSSRQAARMLMDAEGGNPLALTSELLGDKQLREDACAGSADLDAAGSRTALAGRPAGPGPASGRYRVIIGVIAMTFALGLLVAAAFPQVMQAPASVPTALVDAPPAASPAAAASAPDAAVVDAASRFLALLDQSDWQATYQATASQFRRLNTLAVWSDASEQARAPLGAVVSRNFMSQQNLPAPPMGYEVVKFRTRFTHKADAIETVTLEREDGAWRIVGIIIE